MGISKSLGEVLPSWLGFEGHHPAEPERSHEVSANFLKQLIVM